LHECVHVDAFGAHRAKLPNVDQPVVETESPLLEEDRTGRVQLYGHSDEKHQRRNEDQGGRGDHLILDELEHVRPAGYRAVEQRQHRYAGPRCDAPVREAEAGEIRRQPNAHGCRRQDHSEFLHALRFAPGERDYDLVGGIATYERHHLVEAEDDGMTMKDASRFFRRLPVVDEADDTRSGVAPHRDAYRELFGLRTDAYDKRAKGEPPLLSPAPRHEAEGIAAEEDEPSGRQHPRDGPNPRIEIGKLQSKRDDQQQEERHQPGRECPLCAERP
jgi:hypothetical protein